MFCHFISDPKITVIRMAEGRSRRNRSYLKSETAWTVQKHRRQTDQKIHRRQTGRQKTDRQTLNFLLPGYCRVRYFFCPHLKCLHLVPAPKQFSKLGLIIWFDYTFSLLTVLYLGGSAYYKLLTYTNLFLQIRNLMGTISRYLGREDWTDICLVVNMHLHVKASFVGVEGGPGTLLSWNLINHNLGCLAEPEIPCILHIIKPKTGSTARDLINVESFLMNMVWYRTVR